MMIISLALILILVLIAPFICKRVEHNLEIFLFVMGLTSAFVSGSINWQLVHGALIDPIPITLAVLAFGLIFRWGRRLMDGFLKGIVRRISVPAFIFIVTIMLGLLSSVITAIIAALLLVEIVSMLKLAKRDETRFVIIACFAIGFGASLTPIGEPLATIAIAKLKSWPDVGFFFLFDLLKWEVICGVIGMAILTLLIKCGRSSKIGDAAGVDEPYREILMRAAKVYLFVMALMFLGEGFKPAIDLYIVKLSADVLYWINMISAVLDNATLTAAEISPSMTVIQVKQILLGLLIAGGMLIPGNIPNIIAASKLKIKSREWATFGVPLGLVFMTVVFIVELLRR